MRYKIVKDASLRQSMTKYRNLGDERWRLFDAILSSTSRDEYLQKTLGLVQERESKSTGKTWLVTPENCFTYLCKSHRIEVLDNFEVIVSPPSKLTSDNVQAERSAYDIAGFDTGDVSLPSSVLSDLFSDCVKEIESEYRRLGHQLGWRFITGPKATFSPHTEVAFISLNPGGDIDLPDHPHESSEQGSAYLIECWKGKAAGTENLQIQFQRLATTLQQHFGDKSSLADYINTKILTAHFIPFRSQRFETLHAKAESINFGRKLWERIFKFILPRTIITLDPEAFGAISEIISSSGGVQLSHERFQTGWGAGTRKPIGCEVRKYRQASKMVTILRLPHLSTYKLFSREECAPCLSEIFGYVCCEHPPLGTVSHGR